MNISQNVSLKNYSNYKIGGNASYFAVCQTPEELIEILKEWKTTIQNITDGKTKIFVLGEGTNVLIPDEGYKGLVIKNEIKKISLNHDILTVGSGNLISEITDFCIEKYLSGFEWAGGLPGTVGGAIRGNAGAFSGEIKDNISSVKSIDTVTLKEKTREYEDLSFDYRNSVFKKGEGKGEIIIEATFKLKKGEKSEIEKLTREKIEHRNTRHPLEYPNIGSTFKNIEVEKVPEKLKDEFTPFIKNDPFPVIPAAKLLSLAGLKGKKVGDAQVSEKHPNFIVNLGNAKASDVRELISQIKNEIRTKFGIELEEEIMYL